MFKTFIVYLWQLPQNLLGLLVIFATKSKRDVDRRCWITNHRIGISLGKYIILGKSLYSENEWRHEYGHCRQSLIFGWLYLLLVGLPSFLRNIWDKIFHRHWNIIKRLRWYYGHYPENWADTLGGASRNIYFRSE